MYGGNKLLTYDLSKSGKQIFAQGAYDYLYVNIKAGEIYKVIDLRSFSVYFFSLPTDTEITINGEKYEISQGDALQVEGVSLKFSATRDMGIFVSGVYEKKTDKTGLTVKQHNAIYKVEKPWGHELWISGDNHPSYAFKQIFVKKGTKTSLQYHNVKRETNVLVEGRCYLHFKKNDEVSNDNVKSDDIGTTELKPISVIDIVPQTLHRLEAITDIMLYETSTPYLDDVIRVQDDAKRPDGRIDEEHKKII